MLATKSSRQTFLHLLIKNSLHAFEKNKKIKPGNSDRGRCGVNARDRYEHGIINVWIRNNVAGDIIYN